MKRNKPKKARTLEADLHDARRGGLFARPNQWGGKPTPKDRRRRAKKELHNLQS